MALGDNIKSIIGRKGKGYISESKMRHISITKGKQQLKIPLEVIDIEEIETAFGSNIYHDIVSGQKLKDMVPYDNEIYIHDIVGITIHNNIATLTVNDDEGQYGIKFNDIECVSLEPGLNDEVHAIIIKNNNTDIHYGTIVLIQLQNNNGIYSLVQQL